MYVKTINNSEKEIGQETLDALKMKLKGELLFPGNIAYDESGSVWNGMISRRPAFIVRCLGTADIIAAVQFARENNLLLCVKAGGHNIAGLAIAEGGMMIDMSLMRGVWVDKKNRTARAQGGCLLGDIDRETQLYGLAAILGFVSQTGAAGLTLGGGFGYLTRRWGWTADNITSMEIVTAEGIPVTASENENSDLFWGLRGGGGNFGVVTSIDYKLYPVGPDILGGLVVWPATDAEKVLDLYRKASEAAPPELALVTLIRPAPAAPWLPKEWHGKAIIGILACWSGNPDEGHKYLKPIKKFGNPIADILVPRPYIQLQSLLDTANPKGRRYYWKSEYLSSLNQKMDAAFINHGLKITSPYSALILFQLGGALNKLDDTYSPAVNRDAKYVFNAAASWEDSSEDKVHIKWTRDAWTDLKQYSTGGTYLNFLTEDDGYERTPAALGNSIKRLREIKRKWDPDNFFRSNWNIKPAEERIIQV